MHKFLFGLAILCVLCTTPFQVSAQSNDSNLIAWSAGYKLSYDDFTGKPGKEAEVALTSSGFYFLYDYDGKSQLTIELYSMFDKSSSWFKEEGKVPEVLSHEQTHFDITEVNVRLFRKALMEKTFSKGNNFDVMLPRMYDEYIDKCTNMQNDYDHQTNHGINTDVQKGWEKKIAKKLEDLKQYNSTELLFKVN